MNNNSEESKSETHIDCETEETQNKEAYKEEEKLISTTKKLLSMLFFGFSGFALILANKTLLSVYSFPSPTFLGLSQCLTTVVIIVTLKAFKITQLPTMDSNAFLEVLPIAICFFGNLIFGLLSTKYLSLPMFTTLRRCILPFAMVLQYFFLQMKPEIWSLFSVSVILIGTGIAAFRDLSFSLVGYISILAYNISTGFECVLLKRSLSKYNHYTRMQLVFLCSFCAMFPLLALNLFQDEFYECFTAFRHWTEVPFLVAFTLCLVLGLALNYSMVLCNDYTTPLTLQVIAQLRSIAITFIGFAFGGGYTFDTFNIIGINLCLLGSLVHTYFTVKRSADLSKTEGKKTDMSNP